MCQNNENDSEILSTQADPERENDATEVTSAERSDEDVPESPQCSPSVLSEEKDEGLLTTPLKKNTQSFTRNIFEYLELFVCSICVVFLVFMFGVRLCDVTGESMEKTLYEKEKLLISDLFYEPERGDIIVFHQTGDVLNEPVVKRVIATGGETVVLNYQSSPQSIIVTVYDENMTTVLDESSYAYYDGTRAAEYNKQESDVYHIPEGYLFVMGDNRNNSADSRSSVIGLVDERRVLGRVILRIVPFSRFGAVD